MSVDMSIFGVFALTIQVINAAYLQNVVYIVSNENKMFQFLNWFHGFHAYHLISCVTSAFFPQNKPEKRCVCYIYTNFVAGAKFNHFYFRLS